MSQYARGRRLEYKAKHFFEREGFAVVIRSAGSHGKVDVVAIRGSHDEEITRYDGVPCVWLIQCKTKDRGNMSRNKKALVKLARQNNVHAAWWSANRGRVNLWV